MELIRLHSTILSLNRHRLHSHESFESIASNAEKDCFMVVALLVHLFVTIVRLPCEAGARLTDLGLITL